MEYFTSKKIFSGILLFSAFSFLLLPALEDGTIHFPHAEAALSRSDARDIAKKAWNNFLNQRQGGGTTSSNQTQEFGGRVILPMYCSCSNDFIFIQKPVHGPEGPILVPLYGNALKQWWSIGPGNSVLGTANQGGQCRIQVGPYCFSFNVDYTITFTPGMGTSFIP